MAYFAKFGDCERRAGKIVHLNFRDFGEYQDLFPSAHVEYAQIGRGQLGGTATVLELDNARFVHLTFEPSAIGTVAMDRRRATFVIPLRLENECCFSGEVADPSTFYLFASANGYTVRSAKRNTMCVSLPRSKLIAQIAALRGVDPSEVSLAEGALRLPWRTLEILRRRVQAWSHGAASELAYFVNQRRVHELTQEITNIMVDAYCRADQDDDHYSRRVPIHTSIVRRADELFTEAGARSISLADICRTTGVSANTLNAAFHHIRGVPPLKYFKLRRLYRARESLLRARDERAAIKRAALDAGLTHLGRFSAEYKEAFGELPSSTLKRNVCAVKAVSAVPTMMTKMTKIA